MGEIESKDQSWRQLLALCVKPRLFQLLPGSLMREAVGQYNRVQREDQRVWDMSSPTWETHCSLLVC